MRDVPGSPAHLAGDACVRTGCALLPALPPTSALWVGRSSASTQGAQAARRRAPRHHFLRGCGVAQRVCLRACCPERSRDGGEGCLRVPPRP